MKTLKESILSGMEDMLSTDNAYSKMYPAPTINDFNGTTILTLDWYCKDLLHKYMDAKLIKSLPDYRRADYNTIRVTIHDTDDIRTYLAYKESPDDYSAPGLVELKGVGNDISHSMSTTKKAVVKFFEYLHKHPDEIKTVLDYHIECVECLKHSGAYFCKTFSKILGY